MKYVELVVITFIVLEYFHMRIHALSCRCLLSLILGAERRCSLVLLDV